MKAKPVSLLGGFATCYTIQAASIGKNKWGKFCFAPTAAVTDKNDFEASGVGWQNFRGSVTAMPNEVTAAILEIFNYRYPTVKGENRIITFILHHPNP